MEDINLSCIANDVVNGHSFQFAAYDSTSKFTSKNWHSQQLFTFDIDNLKPTSSMDIYILIDELSKLHLRPALVYSTYGNADREELTRFRMMFVCDREVRSRDNTVKIIKFIAEIINSISPGSIDMKCMDLARLFFPGQNIIFYDEMARINASLIVQTYNLDQNAIGILDTELLYREIVSYFTKHPCPGIVLKKINFTGKKFLIFKLNYLLPVANTNYLGNLITSWNTIQFNIYNSKNVLDVVVPKHDEILKNHDIAQSCFMTVFEHCQVLFERKIICILKKCIVFRNNLSPKYEDLYKICKSIYGIGGIKILADRKNLYLNHLKRYRDFLLSPDMLKHLFLKEYFTGNIHNKNRLTVLLAIIDRAMEIYPLLAPRLKTRCEPQFIIPITIIREKLIASGKKLHRDTIRNIVNELSLNYFIRIIPKDHLYSVIAKNKKFVGQNVVTIPFFDKNLIIRSEMYIDQFNKSDIHVSKIISDIGPDSSYQTIKTIMSSLLGNYEYCTRDMIIRSAVSTELFISRISATTQVKKYLSKLAEELNLKKSVYRHEMDSNLSFIDPTLSHGKTRIYMKKVG